MTDYVRLKTGKRTVDIPLAVTGFGKPYKELFNKAVASGYEVWLAYFDNNFDNPFQKADEELYKKMGGFTEIVKDKVSGRKQKKGEMSPGEGFVPVAYETPSGKKYLWLPRDGIIMPHKDERKGVVWFNEGTLAPLETVPFDQRSKVEQRFSELDIPKGQISGFYRLDDYKNEKRFVGRGFDPGIGDFGRFGVDAGGFPSGSGYGGVGVRSADEKKIVKEIVFKKK